MRRQFQLSLRERDRPAVIELMRYYIVPLIMKNNSGQLGRSREDIEAGDAIRNMERLFNMHLERYGLKSRWEKSLNLYGKLLDERDEVTEEVREGCRVINYQVRHS